ncbi:glucanase B [Elsinoe ampelina]|uniref:Glucanase B n=1 Tax=Elsinoe ampelina TaxID=302913 RepID=A0A6A6G717_9PEZI|nr:glucanase B [Elsinoe ampelina]
MPDSLQFVIRNNTDSPSCFAYITGLALQQDNQRCFVKGDGNLYFPTAPNSGSILQPLAEDCAVPLGEPGNETTIKVPQIAGGRVWISRDKKLTFLVNPGPALVEPSVLNPSDPNADVDFGFVEFTLNDSQLYANISFVDFVPRLPMGIELETASGAHTKVCGLPPDGINQIADRLNGQAGGDNSPWDKLIVLDKADGSPLRVLNATHGGTVGADFGAYFDEYVSKVWDKYSKDDELTIDTQCDTGVVKGKVNGSGELDFGDGLTFARPSTADVLGCNSGPFTTGPDPRRNAIIPRLAAGFVRGTLLNETNHPSDPAGFYKDQTVHHYSRIVHEVNSDGKGYAFAYDDVDPTGGEDQSGKVNAGDPTVFRIILGGKD